MRTLEIQTSISMESTTQGRPQGVTDPSVCLEHGE